MADGSLSARARLAANAATAIYTVPASTAATVDINVLNHGPDPAYVGIAITSGAAPADGDWLEIAVGLGAGQTLLRTAETMSAGEVVYVVADKATVDVRVSGFEEEDT